MDARFIQEFRASGDTLRVYEGDVLIFASARPRLFPLLDYIGQMAARHKPVAVCDRLMGNAAALLSIRAGGREVYSPLGSQLAVTTLEKFGIKYQLEEIVPYIQKPGGKEMCPMEKLSLGKEPEEFYELLTDGKNFPHEK